MENSINIIHLSVRVDRMKILENELEMQGIDNVNIWEGIYHPKSIMKSISLAHKQIIKWAKETGLKTVTVFEDDIKFTDKGAWDYYVDNEPLDYDIYLGGIYLGTIKNSIANSWTAAHCYTVHERFYDVFLKSDEDKHIDTALAGLGKYVVCEPMIAVQYNGVSNNTNQYCNFDSIINSRKLFKNQTNNDFVKQ